MNVKVDDQKKEQNTKQTQQKKKRLIGIKKEKNIFQKILIKTSSLPSKKHPKK